MEEEEEREGREGRGREGGRRERGGRGEGEGREGREERRNIQTRVHVEGASFIFSNVTSNTKCTKKQLVRVGTYAMYIYVHSYTLATSFAAKMVVSNVSSSPVQPVLVSHFKLDLSVLHHSQAMHRKLSWM